MRVNNRAKLNIYQLANSTMHSSKRKVLLLLVSLILVVTLQTFSIAQSGTQSEPINSYDDLAKKIKEYAKQNAENNPTCDFLKIRDYYKSEIELYVKTDGNKLRELRDSYEEECRNEQDSKKWDIFRNFKDNVPLGTIVAGIVIALIGALIRDPIVNFSKSLQDLLATWAYQQLSGQPWFWGWGLRKYKAKLKEQHQIWKNPFGQNLSLNRAEIYVPLNVESSRSNSPVDADWTISDQRRLVITGAPGSGKSMLMRNIALRYADGRLRVSGDPLLILVELSVLAQSLQGVSTTESIGKIEQYLIQVLDDSDFPNAGKLLRQRLEAKRSQPTVLLLFDGLDEVSSSDRDSVTKYLKRFLDHYPEARVVITCRTQVYENVGKPFDKNVDQTLKVVEFKDPQIRRFLQPWKKVMTGKSTEKLIEELKDRPRIQELARNPMLLTIIASLYAESNYFELPHSRAAFYREATHVLLKKWDQDQGKELTRYDEGDKRSLLREIAFDIQINPDRGNRRNIDYETQLLPFVRTWLPNLDLLKADAKPILEDIQFRSGLLMKLDGGETYRFTHLTLQEFFTAEKLLREPQGVQQLIQHFRTDSDGWREVVKLGCGLASKDQSKILIEQVYVIDPLTAFEALVDVREMDPNLEDKIIEEFKTKLGDPNTSIDIEAAFGLVAANSFRASGDRIFSFLIESTKSLDENTRLAAVRALSLSNLPQAASHLTTYYANNSSMRNAMVGMGDLAVPHLLEHVRQGSLFAIDDLLQIGTPDAAMALANCLWNSSHIGCALRAAWCLAALLPLPEITDALGSMNLRPDQPTPERWKFIWLPFQNPDNQHPWLPGIVSQIVHLLESSDYRGFNPPMMAQGGKVKTAQLDPRLIVPLCTLSVQLKPDISQISIRTWAEAESLLVSYGGHETRQDLSLEIERQISVLGRRSLSQKIRSSPWFQLLTTQAPILQLDLANRLIKPNFRSPTERDWRQLFNVRQYRFDHSWQFHSVVIVSLILSCLALLNYFWIGDQLFRLNKPFGWLACLGLAIIPTSWLCLLTEGWPISPVQFRQIAIGGCFTFWSELLRFQQQHIVWTGTTLMLQCLTDRRFALGSLVSATVGAVWLKLFDPKPEMAWFGMGLVISAIALLLLSAGAWISLGLSRTSSRGGHSYLVLTAAAGIVAPMIPNGLGWTGLVILLSGLGLGVTTSNHQSRWLVVSSYPLFCGFPAVLIGLALPMILNENLPLLGYSRPLLQLLYVLLIGSAAVLWIWGRSKEYHASNPFKDLPELAQYNPNPSQSL
jgi:hypothetical protein